MPVGVDLRSFEQLSVESIPVELLPADLPPVGLGLVDRVPVEHVNTTPNNTLIEVSIRTSGATLLRREPVRFFDLGHRRRRTGSTVLKGTKCSHITRILIHVIEQLRIVRAQSTCPAVLCLTSGRIAKKLTDRASAYDEITNLVGG